MDNIIAMYLYYPCEKLNEPMIIFRNSHFGLSRSLTSRRLMGNIFLFTLFSLKFGGYSGRIPLTQKKIVLHRAALYFLG